MAEVLIILRFASEKLSTFLNEEGRFLGGLREDVRRMSDEFGHMKAFLQKMEDFDQEVDDPQLTEWIRQVREVSYETQDIVDEFILLFAEHRPRGFNGYIQWNFKSLKNLPARHRLASKLQTIKARTINISEARLRYESYYANNLSRDPGRLVANNAWRWRHNKDDDALLAEESQLVGINEPKQLLISQLLHFDYQLKVIAVLGMGGLGKTTLVKQVHDDVAVKSHFQIRAWVTISQTCDFQKVLKGLIQQVLAQFNQPVPAVIDTMDIYEMKSLLKDFLQRGRYVIVLDDVWDTEFWDAFKFVLPENSHGGNRVMLTTRKADVASASSTSGYVHEMGYLNFEDSWTLFCRKTFRHRGCPTHLKNVAGSIVAKCGGLPLAIIAIGGLLVTKDLNRTNEWELVQRRLGDEFEGSGKLDRVKRILSLSYNDLSSTLKTCLLYTSIFPEDYTIPCLYLINLWVAEQFVEDREGQTAEEIAWNNLKELANRSLIQLNQVRYNGLYAYAHIHDVLREFIASKSREQNMVAIINTTKQIRRGCSSGEVIRRLVFHHNLPEIISPETHISNVRAIVNFGRKKSPSKALLTKLLTSKLFTVLDLRGIELEEIPEEIFRLFHLKYLGITGKRIKKMSKSIQGLQNLECLILKETNIKELPVEIKKLHRLRHLFAYQLPAEAEFMYDGFKAPRGMGELLELQTLSVVDAADSDKTKIVSEIGKLVQLKKLCIKNLRREDGKELCSSLEKLTNLQELVMASSAGKNEAITLDLNHPVSASFLQSVRLFDMFGRLEKFPPWIRNLQCLEQISLNLSNLLNDPLETLQLLPNLLELSLFEAYQGEGLCFKAGGFLKLTKLSLKLMNGLRWVRVEKGTMPVISKITMEDLPLIEEIPCGIEHLRQLQKLELWGMSCKLTDKLENAADNEEESEDCVRISHIPQVMVGFKKDGQWRYRQLSPRKKAQAKKDIDQLPIQVDSAGALAASYLHLFS